MNNKLINLILIILVNMVVSCKNNITDHEKKDIKNDLDRMYKIDQIAAFIPEGKYKNYTQQQWETFKDSVFTKNTLQAKKIFDKYGYPGFSLLDKEKEAKFWAIIQHSDKFPRFQEKVLRSLKKQIKKNNASPEHYALLYDRIKVKKNEKQLFGTQLDYKSNGQAIPKIGLMDSVNIDKLRKQYHLEPLKEYLNFMTERHFQMNKNIFAKEGIIEPILYK
ncbi:hypothetical protein K0U91_07070 [Chryseobacterium chendengshani]|uniref:DUF6624 domain-containing protein n=1 Tax=Chryseobacterium sp. LJ668 TaxID=2864040 RepID=UPI001C691452|nr:DUF6624 domain-containing protein [Chryseobacterium sp. LJ668]MBW8522229.1 hypothetical protein [Chryseobacterium sp. LJ668]QYK17872.1 hypothetical protein K0U91_07070 [Chryseobacterium sp. LJ668]